MRREEAEGCGIEARNVLHTAAAAMVIPLIGNDIVYLSCRCLEKEASQNVLSV